MTDSNDPKAESSAEKAYAAASEAVPEKVAAEPASKSPEAAPTTTSAVTAPLAGGTETVEFPAKGARLAKPTAPKVVSAEPKTDLPTAAEPQRHPAPSAETAKSVTGNATKSAAPKAKPVAKAARKPVSTRSASSPKIVKSSAAETKVPFIAQLKEIPMDVTASIKDAANGAQEKAKEAMNKTGAVASEYVEFAKGNVEACVESSKILAGGLQELGKTIVADSKTAFETATADAKALTGVKSPTDLFQLQTELLRRNFDSAIAYSSKTSEAMLKLTSDVIAPLSARMNLAVEKIKKAA